MTKRVCNMSAQEVATTVQTYGAAGLLRESDITTRELAEAAARTISATTTRAMAMQSFLVAPSDDSIARVEYAVQYLNARANVGVLVRTIHYLPELGEQPKQESGPTVSRAHAEVLVAVLNGARVNVSYPSVH